ncbi:hypothetical protein Cni_G07611 [Canna indica]|uniref:Uncharacterized protein n=1 Tax=Canna indica TaxID=4628 RepID=A0AAQ3JYS9_9LILI|nr:hypothetical protein Cni_G07611 [Canna indica]
MFVVAPSKHDAWPQIGSGDWARDRQQGWERRRSPTRERSCLPSSGPRRCLVFGRGSQEPNSTTAPAAACKQKTPCFALRGIVQYSRVGVGDENGTSSSRRGNSDVSPTPILLASGGNNRSQSQQGWAATGGG